MYKVIAFCPLTSEFLFSKIVTGEDAAEKLANNWWSDENNVHSTWEPVV